MTTLQTNGITVAYEDTGGEGRPVVLIHGWPLSGASWAEQKPALLKAGFRVISYDRRGFGASDKPEDGYDYDTLTADLVGLLEALDLRDAVLVGFSMGGGEVVRYLAGRGPDRVGAAVLAGAVPPYLLKTDDNPDGGLTDEDVEEMRQSVRSDRTGFLRTFLTSFYSANGELLVSTERVEASLALSEPAREEAVLGCIDAFARTDFRSELSSISQPCLVIHGDADAIVPLEVSGRRSAELLGDARLVVIENGPHGFNLSHAERFNKALLDFLGS